MHFNFSFGFGRKKPETIADTIAAIAEETRPAAALEEAVPAATAQFSGYAFPQYNNVYSIGFDGEKNLGEMGPIRRYVLDHERLRLRSWQLYLESEICQIVFRRFARWVIGKGLKLQAEPQADVLASEGITIDAQAFSRSIEARFAVFASTTGADYADMKTLHKRAKEAFVNAIVGGDVLVILRYIDGEVKQQLIDGCHVANPPHLTFSGVEYRTAAGNIVRHGVELDETGRHLAYYVRKGNGLEYERIPARGEKSGVLLAFLVYGLEYRLDNVRGVPLIVAVMEKAKKMERYEEATLGSAEERAKIPYFIEHGITSTGESPLQKLAAKASGLGPASDIPTDVRGQQFADTVAATANKMVFNMPNDSKLVSVESDAELHFEPFFTVNIELVCATVGIPPNVAMMKYNDSFSASRAALKDWEHTLEEERAEFGRQYYDPFYALFLDTEVMKNKVVAPGYLTARAANNRMAIGAYRKNRWVGANVPHIDPLKEVDAERAKLGPLGAHLPLTTLESAVETLNGGESRGNVTQFAQELQDAAAAGLKPVPAAGDAPADDNEEGDDKPKPKDKK